MSIPSCCTRFSTPPDRESSPSSIGSSSGCSTDPGDEPPADGAPDDADWLVLVDSGGVRKLAFQQVDHLLRTTWPNHDVPMQLHVDFTVSSGAELHRQGERAEALGAELVLDRTDDPDEPLFVFADLSGHPFCVFVA